MPQKGQSGTSSRDADPDAFLTEDYINETPRSLVASTLVYPDGWVMPWHIHKRGQLVRPVAGSITVRTEAGVWSVPPHLAVWLPRGLPHRLEVGGSSLVQALYVAPTKIETPLRRCGVVVVSPLLRELINYAAVMPRLYAEQGAAGRVVQVLIDQIVPQSVPSLVTPTPRDRRLRAVIAMLERDPADGRGMEAIGRAAGASKRTLSRRFVAEMGMTFHQWRQHLRVQEAMRRLAAGEAVTNVALDLGYQSPSAFIAVFKKLIGQTPGRFFSER